MTRKSSRTSNGQSAEQEIPEKVINALNTSRLTVLQSHNYMEDVQNDLNHLGDHRNEVDRALHHAYMVVIKESKNTTAAGISRDLSRIIRDGLSEFLNRARSPTTILSLPDKAPVKYVPRQNDKASVFLKKHWGQYIESGLMFRPDLKRLDAKLEMALRNEFRGRPDELRALLPNRSDRTDARLAAAFGEPVAPARRKSAMTALSIAKRLKTPNI